MSRIFLCLMLCMVALGGCVGGSSTSGGSPARDMSACTEAYTYAPAAYVIYIVSGDAVILDPLANDFPLYCDVESATTGMRAALASGAINPGDWKIFRVYGEWADIASETENGVFLLNKAAPLVDWVS